MVRSGQLHPSGRASNQWGVRFKCGQICGDWCGALLSGKAIEIGHVVMATELDSLREVLLNRMSWRVGHDSYR